MCNFSRIVWAPLAIAAALVALAIGPASKAATFAVPQHTFEQDIAIVSGSVGGTITFTLDLDDPTLAKDIFGSFSADMRGPDLLSRGQVSLFGSTTSDTGPDTTHLGDATGTILFGDLANVTDWTLTVGPSDLPLSIVITTSLDGFFGDSFAPTLTVDVTSGLTVTSAAPLPGALALFASGAGLLGLVGARRRATARPKRS